MVAAASAVADVVAAAPLADAAVDNIAVAAGSAAGTPVAVLVLRLQLLLLLLMRLIATSCRYTCRDHRRYFGLHVPRLVLLDSLWA